MGDELSSQAQLADEVHALRAALSSLQQALGMRYRLTLSVGQAQPFLGQAASLVATVTDWEGDRPQVDVPVLFFTSWGRLRSVDRLVEQKGSGVTAHTGVDGTARATLFPPTAEALQPSQQAFLQYELSQLPVDAKSPRAIEEQLQAFVRHYQWADSAPLRQAVDVCFRDLGQNVVDDIVDVDYMQAWRTWPANVIAHVCPDGPDGAAASQVHSTAALTLQFKDWLGAWLQTFLKLSREENPLAEEFGKAVEVTPEPGVWGEQVYAHIGEYIGRQRGRIGAHVGQKVAGQAIDSFMAEGLKDVSPDARLKVLPTLRVASRTIATTGAGTLAGLSDTRRELRQELGGKIDEGLRGKADQSFVESGLGLKADHAFVESRLGLKADQTFVDERLRLKADQTFVDERLKLKADQTFVDERLRLKADQSLVTQQLQLKADQSLVTQQLQLKADQSLVTQQLQLKADESSVKQRLAAKAEQAAVNQQLGAKADQSFVVQQLSVKADQSTVDQQLSTKVDQGTFERELNARVTVDSLRELSERVAKFDAVSTKVDRMAGLLDKNFRGVDPEFSRLRVLVGPFHPIDPLNP